MAKRVGGGTHAYELDPTWGRLPDGWEYRDVVGVRVGRDGRVYAFNRGTHPMIVFDRSGAIVATWGDGIFGNPHGLAMGPDGTLYCVDNGDHTVRAFTPEGALKWTIGTPGIASDTGWTGSYDTLRGGPPFNRPTNLAVGAQGDLYVSDGYGNCRVHRFSADGALKQSWGSAGRGAGQFRLPHGACGEPDGSVLIGDRANFRVQRFTADGQYRDEWADVQMPDDIYRDADGIYYVAELGKDGARAGDLGSRVTVRDRSGRILASWGDTGDPTEPGNICAAHGICTDADGNVYVGEVTQTARIGAGLVPAGTHVFQRFVRV